MLLNASVIVSRPRATLRTWLALSALALTTLLSACGGGGGGASPPPAATLTSISITPPAPTLAAGATVQFKATGTYSDSTTKDLTATVTWKSVTTTVATISSGGLATWVGAGTTTITATSGTISGSVTLTASAATLQSIAVTTATPSIAKGTFAHFVATGTYTGGSTMDLTNSVTWTSSAPSVASISSTAPTQGKATALYPTGNTPVTITASYTPSGSTTAITGSMTLTITAATLSSLTVSPATSNIFVNTTEQLTAMGTFSDNTTQDLTASATWSAATGQTLVSVGNTATSKGFVTAGATATAANTPVTITASYTPTGATTAVTGTATVAVTAATLSSIAITPVAPSIAAGINLQFKAIGTFTPGGTQDITGTVMWSSATPAVASISNAAGSQGIAHALAVGTTTITASAGNGTGLIITSTPAATLTVTNTLYAYATNFQDNTVSQFSLGAGGVLTPLSPLTIAAGSQPFSVSVEPTGQYVYVADFLSKSVSQYSIGSATGMAGLLAPVGTTGTVTTGLKPNNVTLDHSNKFAYVADYGDNTVSEYSIGGDGTLTALATSPVQNGANTYPSAITIDPTDKYAYVTNWASPTTVPLTTPSTVTEYLINPDGSLSINTNSPTVVCGGGPNAIVVDPSGKFAYVVNSGTNNVSQYTLRSDGVLIPVVVNGTATPTVAAGQKPFGLAVDPTSHYLYVANVIDGTISQYSINQTSGALTPLTPASVPSVVGSTTSGVSSVTIDPTGTYLYAPNRGSDTISQFQIGAGGLLTPLTPATVVSGTQPTAIAIGY